VAKDFTTEQVCPMQYAHFANHTSSLSLNTQGYITTALLTPVSNK